MQCFTFQLVDRDLAVLAEQVLPLPDEKGIWDHVATLAVRATEPGARIRVLNEQGGIVASLGVASAQKLFEEAA